MNEEEEMIVISLRISKENNKKFREVGEMLTNIYFPFKFKMNKQNVLGVMISEYHKILVEKLKK